MYRHLHMIALSCLILFLAIPVACGAGASNPHFPLPCDYYSNKARETEQAANREGSMTAQRQTHDMAGQAYRQAAAKYREEYQRCISGQSPKFSASNAGSSKGYAQTRDDVHLNNMINTLKEQTDSINKELETLLEKMLGDISRAQKYEVDSTRRNDAQFVKNLGSQFAEDELDGYQEIESTPNNDVAARVRPRQESGAESSTTIVRATFDRQALVENDQGRRNFTIDEIRPGTIPEVLVFPGRDKTVSSPSDASHGGGGGQTQTNSTQQSKRVQGPANQQGTQPFAQSLPAPQSQLRASNPLVFVQTPALITDDDFQEFEDIAADDNRSGRLQSLHRQYVKLKESVNVELDKARKLIDEFPIPHWYWAPGIIGDMTNVVMTEAEKVLEE